MSGMFDDWAYSSVYEPPSPPRAPKTDAKRPRAVSIVRSVAQAPTVPEPVLRPRAKTVDGSRAGPRESRARTGSPAAAPLTHDVPLTRFEREARWSLETWLGHHSPSMFDFKEDIWLEKLVPYCDALQEAELAAGLAADARTSAQDMVREVDWLLHELRDTREHDLGPLRAAAQRKQGLDEQKKTLSEVQNALDVAWGSQDRIMRALHGPAPRAVPRLGEIMDQIDRGLQFCAKHPDFVGIEVTAQAWQTCAQRALAIATAYCTHELRKISQRITSRVGENSSDGARHALIYTKFAADAERLRPVLALLRDHSGSAPGSISDGHWLEMQSIYFDFRAGLVDRDTQKFAEALVPFAQLGDEFLEAARNALVQYRQLYAAEQRLFESLLGAPTPEFWNWLNDVSDPLYVVMRRLIVRETDIGRLGQLIILVHSETAVQGELRSDGERGVPDADQQELGSEPRESREPPAGPVVGTENEPGSAFDTIYRDAQNRLVFRANLIVDGLARYEPSPKDLLRARYPTVEQALNLLGQVYELLNTRVFNDLAHRCVRECLVSLDIAVANRVAASSGSDVVRVHLFHIKQLLTLQSQIVDFDLQRTVVQEVDFSGIQRLMLRDTGSRTASFRDLLALAWDSVPQVVEIMFDAMEELYGSLRMAIDRMCRAFVTLVSGPLEKHSPDAAVAFRSTLVTELKQLESSVTEYISNSEVANFLLDSVQEAVVDSYTTYYRSLSPSDLGDDSLMDVDTMASWLSTTIADTRRT